MSSPEATDMTTGHILNQIAPPPEVLAPVIAVHAPIVSRNPVLIQ